MQLVSILRRVVPVIAVAAMVLFASCNGGSKKYGCPNKLSISLSK